LRRILVLRALRLALSNRFFQKNCGCDSGLPLQQVQRTARGIFRNEFFTRRLEPDAKLYLPIIARRRKALGAVSKTPSASPAQPDVGLGWSSDSCAIRFLGPV